MLMFHIDDDGISHMLNGGNGTTDDGLRCW